MALLSAVVTLSTGEPLLAQTPLKESCGSFDHSHVKWNLLLRKHVSDGFVNYRSLKLKSEHDKLKSYLGELSALCLKDYEKFSELQKISFWINVYNASMVELVLRNYPLKSVRSIGFLPLAAFRKRFIPIHMFGYKDMSLGEVENKFLRKKFVEPRIHFALVCASKSCPKLRSKAYVATDLHLQLEKATHDFLSDPKKNFFDTKSNILHLSKIFSWYDSDFGKNKAERLKWIKRYLPKNTQKEMGSKEIRFDFLNYDWSLNGE